MAWRRRNIETVNYVLGLESYFAVNTVSVINTSHNNVSRSSLNVSVTFVRFQRIS